MLWQHQGPQRRQSMGLTPPAIGAAVEGYRHPQQQYIDKGTGAADTATRSGYGGGAGTASGAVSSYCMVEAKGRTSSRSLRRGGGRAVRPPDREADIYGTGAADTAVRSGYGSAGTSAGAAIRSGSETGYIAPKTAEELDNVMHWKRSRNREGCTAPAEGRFGTEGVQPLVEYVVHINAAAGERGRTLDAAGTLAVIGTLDRSLQFEKTQTSPPPASPRRRVFSATCPGGPPARISRPSALFIYAATPRLPRHPAPKFEPRTKV
jgi:hypothetical protein